MKKFLLAGALSLAFCLGQAGAQLHYDPYYALPGKAKTCGALAGIDNWKISEIGDATDIMGMYKHSLSDKLEVGARVTIGSLHEGADALSMVVAGAKWGLGEKRALSANFLVPLGDADDPGLSVGIMNSMALGGLQTNWWLQAGLLKGYAPDGVGLDLLGQCTKGINDKLTGYLDLLVNTNTDEIGDNLGVNLRPHVDYKLNDKSMINLGISIGLAGDAKQDDPGLRAAFKMMIE
jgi:hypothetical protein